MAGLSEFEAMIVAKVADASEAFGVDLLSGVSGLSDEYGVQLQAGDALNLAAPTNWDPDDFTAMAWGRADFASDDGRRHVVFRVDGDADNYAELSVEADGTLRARVRYHGLDYDATLTPGWALGDWVFAAMRFAGPDTPVVVLYDTDGDGTLESGESAARVGVAYPTVTGGRFSLDTTDNGNRFVKSSGRVTIQDGSPVGGLAALVGRDGRFTIVEA